MSGIEISEIIRRDIEIWLSMTPVEINQIVEEAARLYELFKDAPLPQAVDRV